MCNQCWQILKLFEKGKGKRMLMWVIRCPSIKGTIMVSILLVAKWTVSWVSLIHHCSLNRTSRQAFERQEWKGILKQCDLGLDHYLSFGPAATSNLPVIAIFYRFCRSDRKNVLQYVLETKILQYIGKPIILHSPNNWLVVVSRCDIHSFFSL